MTRVDFYVIPSADPDARLTIACRLADKAWRQGMRVYLLCADETQREALDARLWSFRKEAFVPHNAAEEDAQAPVTLGLGEPPAGRRDLLINLTLAVPAFAGEFSRIAELVVEEPAIRQAARENFRYYRAPTRKPYSSQPLSNGLRSPLRKPEPGSSLDIRDT